MHSIICIGNPVYDIIETPSRKSKTRVLSGTSTNSAISAKFLGSDVCILGAIGRDYVKLFEDCMRKHEIKTKVIVRDETTGFHLVYHPDGTRKLSLIGNAGKILPEDIKDFAFDFDGVVLGPVIYEVPPETIVYIRNKCPGYILLDPQGLMRRVRDGNIEHYFNYDDLREVFSSIDIIKPNEYEAYLISGKRDPYVSIEKIFDLLQIPVIITLAERGSIVYDGSQIAEIPSYRTSTIDSTGAGDTYAGAFISKYVETKNIIESAAFASAMASFVVEIFGADYSFKFDDVRSRAEKILEGINVREI